MRPASELTARAVSLGIVLAILFGVANAYLAVKAGQTIAATLPAAVIGLAVLNRRKRANPSELNAVYTAASVGSALVTAAAFVVPAFLIVRLDGRPLWTDLRSHCVETTMLLLIGGTLGVLLTGFIRPSLFADMRFPWPESVATSGLIRGSLAGGGKARLMSLSAGFAALIHFLTNPKGFHFIQESNNWFLPLPRWTFGLREGGRPPSPLIGVPSMFDSSKVKVLFTT